MSKELKCDGCGENKSPLKQDGSEWLCNACRTKKRNEKLIEEGSE